MSTWVILLAAGSGTRFGGRKQDELVGKRPLWRWSYDSIVAAEVDGVVVVGDGLDVDTPVVAGGTRRQDSVAAGLAAVPEHCEFVLVHDAARPAVSPALISAVLNRLKQGDVQGVVPALAVTDTIKVVSNELVVSTPDRTSLVAVQTPQGFRTDVLRRCHAETLGDVTDDASMLEAMGYRVAVVPGEAPNMKVTRREDLDEIRRRLT